jgi:hypothetical protein
MTYYDDGTDWDNEREHRAEMAADPDRQRLDYTHQFGPDDTDEEIERKTRQLRQM